MLLRLRTIAVVLACAGLLVAAPRTCGARIAAQPAATRAVRAPAAPSRDTLFDFLVGEWRVEASPRISKLAAFVHGVPRFTGHWRGRRTDAGVSDEVRAADAGGVPRLVLRFERGHDPRTRSWSVQEIDRDGKASERMQPIVTTEAITLPAASRVYRSRFVERTPTRFRYLREVSPDGGRTWEEPVLVVTATRTAATPLAPR
jgi:hypothetical protein